MDIYDLTVSFYIRGLKSLKHILTVGEKYANENGIDHSQLLNASLAPDMKPLAFQVQSATHVTVKTLLRIGVTSIEEPAVEDNEQSFAELYARIDKYLDFQKNLPRDVLEGKEHAEMTILNGEVKFNGSQFFRIMATPNFFFHVSMAYAILRNQGVPVGKEDFLAGGNFRTVLDDWPTT